MDASFMVPPIFSFSYFFIFNTFYTGCCIKLYMKSLIGGITYKTVLVISNKVATDTNTFQSIIHFNLPISPVITVLTNNIRKFMYLEK